MMVDTVIKLVSAGARYQDDNGIWRNGGKTAREVFAQINSVGRNEFFAAGEAGFRPEHQFSVFAAEYQGETECEFEGKVYAIYRTYHVPGTDTMELYVQKKVGVNNGA